MKILVIGLDCAAPELLLGEESLPNIRQLMELGAYGQLESVIPPITVPAWMCMATSQDPGSLGAYGFRNATGRNYDRLEVIDANWFNAVTAWDQIAMEGGKSVLLGVPPSYPPKRVNGVRVGCFLTPDPSAGGYTHPPDVAEEIEALVGAYPVDVDEFRTDDKDRLLADIREMTRKHFEVARHFLRTRDWDYFQLVEIGLDRIHHGFWKHHDPSHVLHDPDNPYRTVVRDYYRTLDAEIGSLLELLDEDTLVLVLSDHGARPLDGGLCVNEWLIREGLLTLDQPMPDAPTPLDDLAVDWSATRAWSTGGYYARIFMNVEGREPHGVIPADEYDHARAELRARLEATVGPDGEPLGTRVFVPEEIYRQVNGTAPDLIVFFGDLAWRAVGSVGHGAIHVRENDTGPDDCNHAQHGAFILAGPGVQAVGELEGVRLLDMAPTILDLAGFGIPSSMQGTALPLGGGSGGGGSEDDGSGGGGGGGGDADGGTDPDDARLVRERLAGLGYIG